MLTPRLLSVKPLHSVSLPFLADAVSAYAHLCDHLLTRPEADYWYALLPVYGNFLDPEDDNALFAFAKSLWNRAYPDGHVDGAQELYDDYADAALSALSQAIAQQWYWQEEDQRGRSEWHGLGKCGVYVIWDLAVIRTSMLLGFAAPAPESEPSVDERKHNPLPRQNTWKYRGAELRQDDSRYPSAPAENACYFLFYRSVRRLKREYRNADRETNKRLDDRWIGDRRIVTPLNQNLWHFELAEWQAVVCSRERPGCHVTVEEGELV